MERRFYAEMAQLGELRRSEGRKSTNKENALPTQAQAYVPRNSLIKIWFLAGIAQLVEHNLAKVGVASSNLVSRSSFRTPAPGRGFC